MPSILAVISLVAGLWAGLVRLGWGPSTADARLMLAHGPLMVGSVLGVVIGLGAAVGVTRLMKSLLFGISPLDPVTYTAMPVVLLVAAALASYLPARRAAMVDPVDTLRAE